MQSRQAIRCRVTLDSDNPIVADHRVHGVRSLPGVTFLDLIHRALDARGFPPGRAELRNVLFVEPVVTTEEFGREILLELLPEGTGYRVLATSRRIRDGAAEEHVTRHLEADLHLGELPRAVAPPVAGLPPATEQVDVQRVYQLGRAVGVRHEEFMRCTGTIHVYPEGLLAEIELSAQGRADVAEFLLHPALLDSATMQSYLLAFAPGGEQDDRPLIPIHIESFRAYGGLGDACLVWLRPCGAVTPDADVLFVDIDLLDRQHRPLARFGKLAFKRVRSEALFTRLTEEHAAPVEVERAPEPVAPAPGADLRAEITEAVRKVLGDPGAPVDGDRGFYELGLESMHLLQLVRELEQRFSVRLYPTLLFEYSTVDAVAGHLETLVDRSTVPTVPAVPAAATREVEPEPRTVRLAGRWQPAQSANVPQWTGRLLVLGASEPPGLTDEDLFARPGPEFRCTGPGRYELRAGVAADHRRLFAELDRAGTPPEAVVHLGCAEQGARAVEDAAGELLLLARQLAERTGQRVPLLHASPPELAETLPGLARTVTLEHPRIPATVLESAEVPPVEVLRAELAREETWVRRAGGRRWVRRYAEASDEQAGRPGPRAGGVYLISGGTGALGLAFAGFLTRTVGARVVLFGRSEPDAATEQRLRELGQVRFVRADVTDPADARRVVAEARQHFGPVDGVIHAAGTLADSLLAGKDLDELHRVLAPKVRGTINLDEATRSEPLDFFALFSSVTGTIGNIGQADYAVANAFLAGYAARRERFLAVGWPLWLDGGMSADETALARFREQGQLPLPEAAGIEAFRAALAGPERDVLVFHGDPERIRSSYDLRPVTESVTEPVSAEPVTGPRPVSEEDIAIIGLAGRYPMAEDLDQLWANLLAGRDAVTEVPAERWSQRDFYAAERNTPGRSHSKWGGFLADADRFDPRFFQITPREAEAMDPQERLFLEAVWHTLEDAGYPATRLAGSATGVFAGVMFNQYQLLGLAAPEQLPVLPTSFSSSVANRVSYFLDLHGPSLGLDTMCSSSLTAIHLACQSLRSGDCELAFAGGVNVSVHPYKYLYLSQAGFTSSDGRCRSFGEGGDGYVPGEGVGSVLLKPLSRALADGDRVHAVIRGSAVNHGGRAGGYTVPNPTAQAEVLDAALASSGVDPDTISYIEAHGTGTSLGDPIELAALGKVFGTGIPRPIGSIKSNIGHLEPAAGIAGLTKVLLQLRHRTLVPSLHADPPNPAVDWAATPLRVQRTVEPWAADGVRRAGVSAFGAGGANGHLVLEEFVPPAREEPTPAGPQLVLLSARTEENLRGLAGRYAEFLAPATGGERDVTGDLLAIGAELFGPAVTTVGPDAALAEWGVDTADLLRFEQRIGERFGELPPRPGLDSTVADLAAAVSPSSTVERSGPELADIAYTTQVGRDSFAERLALVVTSTDELRERLRGFAGGGEVAHRGTVTRGAEAPDPERALAERDLDELARLWTAGAAPDWHRLHRGSPVRRVGLPLYPFTRLRCWVSTPDTQAPAGPRPEEQDTDFLHIPGWQATEPPAGTRDDAPVLVLHTPANRWLAEELAARLPGARLADLGDEPANPPPRTVYFLGGVLDGTAALDEAEPAGVLALARWARYLTAERGLSWKVVLAGGNPYTGGLAGFARVLERECPTWTVAVHELDDPRARLDALLAEPAARGARIRHTAEGRYRQVLRPAPPAAGEQAPIRGGGVYVIAGGSGGIGLEMARFLARDHRARVVLLGRREPDAELRGRIAEADPDGGLIEYLRADASDQEALRAARQRIRDRHGPVNGVIHAALVRQERLVRNLDEPALRASLAAKSGVAVALAEVFGGPELDFLLLFSSAQSFLGDAGLAGYAAGSTFLDGYAAALANRLPCRVRVINWGYWGTVGSVADESSRQQLTREGFRSISPELGRRVVLRALSGDAVQLVAVPAEEPLRRRLGTAREEQDALLTRPLAEAEAAAIDGFHALDAELAGAASDWLLRILDELGAWRGTAGEEVSEQDIAGRVGLTARYTGLLGKILRLLTGAGLLRAGEHGYAPLPEPLRRARSGDQQAELDALERRHPEFAVFVRLLALCLSHYPELLRGELLATDLLFPSSGTSLMEAVYKGNAISDVYNDILNDTVLGYVEGRLPGLAAGEKIRILEVGSGTGGTTAGLLRTLARHGAHLEYHYTDLSVTFLEHGKREFGRHYDFLRFTRLDADRDLAAQGLPPGGFDLVIGANVVHATPNLARTLGNLRAALRPDGWLVLNELTTVTVQATVSYGLFDGWWAHDDGQRRLPGSPLLDAEGWREHLTGAGYPEVTALPAAAESTRNFQHVIVARGGAAPATGAASPAAKREAPTGAFARDLLALTSEVSGIPVADLDPEQDLGDVGFDSVSYTLLAQRLNERFAFDVTPTLFYETPNLRALTERLGTEYAQALHGRYAEEPVDPAPVPATTGPAPEPATVDEPLAVVGMAGTLPGSTDLEDFWRRLVEGEDLISELPADRWDWRTGYAEVGADGPVHGRWGGFIEGVAEFDPLFFGISPGEAEQMDPQQRLFLQATWTALENAGIAPGGLAGSDTGVFVGVGSNDYQELQQAAGTVADSFTVTANSHAILPNRISYLLDLHGPSEPVNTGCSASLVAVHRAAESIRHGECDLAVAGGINLILSPRNHVLLSRTGMLSQDGRCRTFDAAADGFVRGEGAGAVVLMTKRRAEAGGHRVLAWLRSSAVNHGGRARSLTAPNPASQAKLLVDAYRKAEVDPATVSYVQCHGTGTELGDPVEVGALTSAFRELSPALAGPEAPEPHCALGAVKTAIGHLESAAGIAGMLTVLLALRHGELPGTPHLERPNPYLRLAGGPFHLLDRARPWRPVPDEHGAPLPRRAGVSSFGFGGVNAHVVLEEVARAAAPPARPGPFVFPLSARTGQALHRYAAALESFLEGSEHELADIAHTLQAGRDAMEHRLAVVAGTRAELSTALTRFRQGQDGPGLHPGQDGDHAATAGPEELAARWAAGAEVEWPPVPGASLVPLPTYPFERRRCWQSELERSAPEPEPAPELQAAAEPEPAGLYLPGWVPVPRPEPAPGDGPVWVVHGADSAPLAEALAAALAPRPVRLVTGKDALEALPEPESVYVLTGVGAPRRPAVGDHLATLAEQESAGLLPLYRVARHLLSRPGLRRLTLTVVTARACAVGDSAVGNPAAAQLLGFARSLRRESPLWTVSAVDLDSADPAEAAAVPPAAGSGDELAHRGGTWYRRALEPWTARPGAVPLRTGGSYLIVGGAGSIGLDVAEHLVRRYRARVALLGRGELDRPRRDRIARFDPDGERVLYLRADAADPAQLRTATATVTERFGPVAGVIHAATVLADGALTGLAEAELRSGLESKTRTSAALVDVFGEQPLDFLLFFSSVQSFLGNPGQSAYAAACAFQDAYAHGLNARLPYPVRVIDWGAWAGSDLAHRHADRLTAAGVLPIPPARGLAALEAVLANPEVQVAVVSGEPDFLNELGVRPRPEPPAPAEGERWRADLRAELLTLVRRVAKVDEHELGADTELRRFGFDSIAYTQLCQLCNEEFDLDLTPASFYGVATTTELADKLAGAHGERLRSRYPGQEPHPPEEPAAPQPRPAARTEQPGREPDADGVAIVGMAGMLPQSDDLDEFWSHLARGADLITEIPADRWDWRRIYGDPEPGEFKTRAKWGGFLRRVDQFDPLFFGISPKEAEAMDPQHRLFLEAAWSCAEDAAIRPSALAGTDTGVFAGCGTYDYFEVQHAFGVELDGYNTVGRAHSILSNRLSYLLDLHGPSETIDTACSSSLVALHRAAEAIRHGDCELAFAGGVNVIASPTLFVDMSQAEFLSPDGRCKTFDAGADGIVRAEGVGVVLLKRLPAALADGDVIHGILRGSAVNHGGRTNSLTAPNPEAQAAVVAKAHRRAGVDPRTIGYIETHGTGTSLGDPVEIEGLKSAFATLAAEHGLAESDRPAGHCALGAVKSNLGHLEAGAGVTGLLKVLLAMRHGMLPANVHIERVNPYIRLEAGPFRILTEAQAWHRTLAEDGSAVPRRAGVSSFGLGGVNAHAVVEEFPPAETARAQAGRHRLFVLSARDADRLRAYADRFTGWLSAAHRQPALDALTYTLQTGREPMSHRLAVVAADLGELSRKLTAWLNQESGVDGVFHGSTGEPDAGLDNLLDGPEGAEYLRSVAGAGRLDKLARLWTRGAEVDWSLLWPGGPPRRIPLPTFPFARESYWLRPGPQFTAVAPEPPAPAAEPEVAPAAGTTALETPAAPPVELERRVAELLANHLGVRADQLRLDRNLAELGVDSLGLRRLSRALSAELGVDIPVRFFAAGQSIHELTAKLRERYPDATAGGTTARAEPAPPRDSVAGLLRGLRSGQLSVDAALRELREGSGR